jgi:uncharacterized protein
MRLEQLPFRSWRSLWRGAIVVIVMLAIWLLVSLVVAYRLTCRGRPRFDEPTPRPAWGRVEGHRIKTSDGEEIGAWFVDNRDNTPSVLLLHGNNGNRRNSLRRAEMLASQGYAVLMISLRAHGDSTGKYNDIGFGARHDVWAAVEFLKARRTNRPVIIIGNSMGSAAAIFAAGTLGHQVAGYILESPYQDLKVAVWNRTDNSLWPGLSHAAYLGLRVVGPLFVPHMDEISPLKAIIGIPDDVPVLILAGATPALKRPKLSIRKSRLMASSSSSGVPGMATCSVLLLNCIQLQSLNSAGRYQSDRCLGARALPLPPCRGSGLPSKGWSGLSRTWIAAA